MNEITSIDTKATALFERVSALIEEARKHVASTVNIAEVYTKYHIGQYIVEEEQEGKERAKYGQQLLKRLSGLLTERYGAGWSYPFLKNIRQFYIVYSKRLHTVYPIQKEKATQCIANSKSETVLRISQKDNQRLSNIEPCFALCACLKKVDCIETYA